MPEGEALVSASREVFLTASDGGSWKGRVARMEPFVNSDTRRRALVVAVEHRPGKSALLMPRVFVTKSDEKKGSVGAPCRLGADPRGG